MSSNSKFRLVPPEEQRCIWMCAGVLSYQLCDRMLDCDGCLLDQAISRRFGNPALSLPDAEAEAPRPRSVQPLRGDLQYTRNHCWVESRRPGTLRFGIEPGLGAALIGPKAIVFPSRGQQLRAGQTCLWIVMDGGTLPLECPIAGTVAGTNRTLAEQPHLLCQEPFEDGWLYELQPEESKQDDLRLMGLDQASRKFDADQNRFMTSLNSAVHGNRPAVGVTLADGGQALRNIPEILGPGKYLSLVRQAFS